jgi:hypothetical protein
VKNGKPVKRLDVLGKLSEGDDSAQALSALRRANAQPHEADIVKYLRGGTTFIFSPGVVRDVLDGSGPIGSGSVLTDGEWAWPDTLPYYVEKYHVELPAEFVSAIAAKQFVQSALGISDLRKLQLPAR